MSTGSLSGSALLGSARPPAQLYDVALLDLDGVVYLGSTAVPGAAAHLAAAVGAGMRLGFVTNNAARSPQQVAEQLTRLGVPADASLVITSAQTAARVLAERLPPGARVLVVGTEALAGEVRQRGLLPVGPPAQSTAEPVAAVVQGYSPDTGWRDLAAACRAVRGGAWWVASNADPTVPSVDGPLPGNGAFVDVVRATTGLEPSVTGKPEPSMHAECLDRMKARRPLVVGDRLDTDIEGASRVGCHSMIVLTGVTRPVDLLGAPPPHRPTYLGADLGALLYAHPEVRRLPAGWNCLQWSVAEPRHTGDGLALAGSGDPLDALRALCAGAWETGLTAIGAADAPAEQALRRLGIPIG
ncbi:MAG: HAD-IIA family hydrolase [Geodermatophilaceae bacterium]